MNTHLEEKQNGISGRSLILMAIASALIGGGALWYTWFRFNDLINQPDFYWYNWVQLGFLVLMGFLCIWAAFLFIAGKSSGWTVFKTGLSVLPLLLFTNLVVLVLRVVQSIFEGNAASFISRLYVSPLNKAILAAVIILALLSLAKGKKQS